MKLSDRSGTRSVRIWRFFICLVTLEASEMQGRCFFFLCFYGRRHENAFTAKLKILCNNNRKYCAFLHVAPTPFRPLSQVKCKKIRLKSHFMQGIVRMAEFTVEHGATNLYLSTKHSDFPPLSMICC